MKFEKENKKKKEKIGFDNVMRISNYTLKAMINQLYSLIQHFLQP